jgi:hypothetical protein
MAGSQCEPRADLTSQDAGGAVAAPHFCESPHFCEPPRRTRLTPRVGDWIALPIQRAQASADRHRAEQREEQDPLLLRRWATTRCSSNDVQPTRVTQSEHGGATQRAVLDRRAFLRNSLGARQVPVRCVRHADGCSVARMSSTIRKVFAASLCLSRKLRTAASRRACLGIVAWGS